jgi:hypothetical protein
MNVHTSTRNTMTSSERIAHDVGIKTHNLPQDIRVALKASLQILYISFTGRGPEPEKVNAFRLAGGKLIGSAIRMYISNQTVILNAAYIPTLDDLPEHKVAQLHGIIAKSGSNVMVIKMDDNEMALSKHLLPAFAERCRQWKHKPTCEYRVNGKVPLSTKFTRSPMCSCGLGVFPTNFIKGMKDFNKVARHAVRVAIPICYPSPISTDNGPGLLKAASPTSTPPSFSPSGPLHPTTNTAASRVQELDAKRGSCFECGETENKGGGSLAHCKACEFAHYCSAECQKANWKKEHKMLCKQLKALS